MSIVFVNAYKVTRKYGGAEEGGWWYDHYECIQSVPTSEEHAETMRAYLLDQHKGIAYGNISSVRGGAELHVIVEEEPCERRTNQRPVYE